MENINTLLKKYDNFKFAQLRTIKQLPDSLVIVTLVTQDDDGEDMNTINIKFINVTDSHILIDSVLPFLDMMSGISIIKEHNLYGFAVGSCNAMTNINNSPLYIVSSDIQVEDN